MGIFGGVPSGRGSGTSRKDRRQAGGRARSKTVARRETERRAQIMILGGIILTAVVVLGVAGFGYYQTSIKPKHQTVLKVGDRSFSMGYVEKRLGYEIKQGSASSLAASGADVAVLQTLNTIESDEITRLDAAQQNMSVSDDEIDAEIRTELAISSTADPATYADAYRNAVHNSGLSPNDYREIIGVKLLEDKLRWTIASGIPTDADQVHLYDIQVSAQADAQKVIDRLNAGEDFGAIAKELSLDTNTKDKGGEMGWTPQAALEASAGDAVFALQAGQWTQPIPSAATGSVFIFKVAEKATAMALTADQQKTIEDQTYQNQHQQVTGQTTIERPYLPIYSEMWNKLADIAVKNGAAPRQQQQ